ncbi:MAG: FAD-dependent oxidoreductase [Coriobacteriales bacterium]|jgi:fumarate reductase flavoprotein subunit|nr:FAD-dependent oxidoreductase [Coriobacteriales bacterium]
MMNNKDAIANTDREEFKNDGGMSRRSFLAGAGILSAGTALALSGCDPSETASTSSLNESTETESAGSTASAGSRSIDSDDSIWDLGEIGEPIETISAQMVVVGGGGTGLAAAIQAAELGLNPLVVEKLGSYGGSFIGTEFINAVGSAQQKATGVEDSVHDIINDHLIYHHWIPRKAIVESLYTNCANTIEWLEAHGIEFEFTAGYRNRALAYDSEGEALRGAHFIKVLSEEAARLGVESLFNTTARKLIVEDGKIASVLVENGDGAIIRIESSAVVIATGGYSNNDPFLRAVSANENASIQALGMDCRHADGIKMAADAGAAMAEGLGTIQWCGPVVLGAITSSWQTDAYAVGVQPTVWLNQDAQRFVREDLWSENFSGAGISVRNQKRTYVLFTETDMEHWESIGTYFSVFGFGATDKPIRDARATLTACDACHIGDTLDEVATATGLDIATLKTTIERYNGFCAAAENADDDDDTADQDFGKKARYLRPVAEGPYWLCEVGNGFFATHGGIKINERTEVLDENGDVIIGLYAGGCDAGGIQGDSYDVMYAGGSTSGWAINTGRNAAKSIAEFLT